MPKLFHPEDANLSRSFWQRVEGGVTRRAQAWHRQRSGQDRATAVDRAWTWLYQSHLPTNSDLAPCPSLVAAALTTAVEYRHRAVALDCANRLLDQQCDSGAWRFAGDSQPARVATALALLGLRAWQPFAFAGTADTRRSPFTQRIARAMQRGALWLSDALNAHSRTAPPIDPLESPELELLIAAAAPDVTPAVIAPLADLAAISAASISLGNLHHPQVAGWRLLCQWGYRELVARRVAQILSVIHPSHATSAVAPATWSSLIALGAELELPAASAALEQLAERQLASGPFPVSLHAPDHLACPWNTVYFLQAERRLAAAAFGGPGKSLALPLSPQDGRVRALLHWRRSLPQRASIVDVGCGSGRYLQQLLRQGFAGSLIGVDLLPSDSCETPAIDFRAGSLLDLPLASHSCDGALAIESLEHSLLPRRAVAELCRIVRPGGQLLIIDKQRRFQPLSLHQPWERWFEPAEVAAWLAEFCDDVTIRPVAHATHREPTGLFVAWTARRRGAVQPLARAA